MNDPYVLSIVAKGYRLGFTSPPLLRQTTWEIRAPPGARGNSRHAGTNQNHPHASEERNNRGASELPRILLKHIHGTQSFRRVASSYRFKKSECPHSCTSFPYVHYKLSSDFCSKRRLHVQNRSAGCVLSRTNSSQQHKVPQVGLRGQDVPVLGATLRSEHSPSDFYSIGAHGDRLSSPSGDLGDTISRQLVNSPPGPPSSTSTSGPAYKYTGPSRLYPKQKEIRAGPDSGSPVSRKGSFPSRVQNLGDSCSRTPSILPPSTNLSSSVPAYGITQLGLLSLWVVCT